MAKSLTTGTKIPSVYYQGDDVVFLARSLLGKKICTLIDHKYTSAMITETEAYRSWGDRACHAHNNKRTHRTEIMFGMGGVTYVYRCYGIHHLLNIVTNTKDHPEAVLIRSVEPLEGIDIMSLRRGKKAEDKRISSGPGNVSVALGVTLAQNGVDLLGNQIWLEKYQHFEPADIKASTRIGVAYAGEDAKHPWRFYLKQNPFISYP